MIIHIAIISPQIYPCITGGVEIFNFYLARELAKRGNNVFVFTSCYHDYDEQNLSVIKIRKCFDIPLVSHVLVFIKLVLFRKAIDIIHVPYTSNSRLIYSILLAKLFFSIPYIISIHGGGMYPWRPRMFHKLFFDFASEIVAVSETIKEEYENRSGRTIKVIPPLIPFTESNLSKNELRHKYGFKSSDIIILSLGSIKKIKGSDILLNAFIDIGKKYIREKQLKLIYVGDGPMKSLIEDKVKQTGLEEYVILFDTIPHHLVAEIYKLSDIYVIPSLFEGTPKSLLEAMFNSLLVIGSNTVGINEILINGENGVLFDTSDYSDLKEKIVLLLENPNLGRMGLNAKSTVMTRYNFEKTIDEFTYIYQDVFGGKQ